MPAPRTEDQRNDLQSQESVPPTASTAAMPTTSSRSNPVRRTAEGSAIGAGRLSVTAGSYARC